MSRGDGAIAPIPPPPAHLHTGLDPPLPDSGYATADGRGRGGPVPN